MAAGNGIASRESGMFAEKGFAIRGDAAVMRSGGSHRTASAPWMRTAAQKALRFVRDVLAFGIKRQQAKIVAAGAHQNLGDFFKHSAFRIEGRHVRRAP